MNEYLQYKYLLVLDNNKWLGFDDTNTMLNAISMPKLVESQEQTLLLFQDGRLVPDIKVISDIDDYYNRDINVTQPKPKHVKR